MYVPVYMFSYVYRCVKETGDQRGCLQLHSTFETRLRDSFVDQELKVKTQKSQGRDNQWLRALASLPEDSGLSLSTRGGSQLFATPVPGNLTPSSGLCR